MYIKFQVLLANLVASLNINHLRLNLMHFYLACEMLFLLPKLLKYKKMEKSAVTLKCLRYFDRGPLP